jgi:hypothetical protein
MRAKLDFLNYQLVSILYHWRQGFHHQGMVDFLYSDSVLSGLVWERVRVQVSQASAVNFLHSCSTLGGLVRERVRRQVP